MAEDKVLTPEQWQDVDRAIDDAWQSRAERDPLDDLRLMARAIAVLRAELASWKATAEELGDKNVNKALLARPEMREAVLRAERDAALARVKALQDALSHWEARDNYPDHPER